MPYANTAWFLTIIICITVLYALCQVTWYTVNLKMYGICVCYWHPNSSSALSWCRLTAKSYLYWQKWCIEIKKKTFRNEVAHFTVVRSTYPDEDQRAGVSHFVLPLRHLDHGELSGARALAQNLPHLRKKTSDQHPASMTHHTSCCSYRLELPGQDSGGPAGPASCRQTIILANGVRN